MLRSGLAVARLRERLLYGTGLVNFKYPRSEVHRMFPHVSTAHIAALARRPLGDMELLVSDMILLTLAVGLVNAE